MKSSEGRGRAISYAPRLSELVLQYQRLNSREARVAFVDTWLKTWAYDFERTWPVIYQTLEWVEQEKLYQDPRVMEPDEIYPDFKSYFEARLKRPFTLWIELEQTHRYVTNFAPELIDKTWPEARDWVLGKHGGDRRSEQAKANQVVRHHLKKAEHWTARLNRDRPDIKERLDRGEFKSVKAAARAAGIKVDPKPLTELRRAWKRASEEERRVFRAEILDA